jgi:hypothetical protein
MFCPNPDCPDARETGAPAEYREGITVCQECGSPLVDSRPEWTTVEFQRFQPVFEIPSPALVPIVDSLLREAGIRFFIQGIGASLAFVHGPVKVYVEPDRAQEARELLTASPAVSLAPPEEAPGSPGAGDE